MSGSLVDFLLALATVSFWSVAADAAPFAYVANSMGHSVSVIDTATNAVTATVPVGGGGPSGGLAVTRDGTRVYVTNFGDDALSIINTATNQVEATVGGCVAPRQVALDPTGSRAYITHGVIPGYVSVLDTATNTVIQTIGVGDIPYGVAVSPDGSHVYVTNTYSNDERCPGFDCILLTVSVIDAAEARETAKVVVGSRPHGIAVDPTGKRAYAAVEYPAGPTMQGSSLAVIDTTINRVLEWIPIRGDLSVAVAPSGDSVYTAGGNQVSVVATNCNLTVAHLLPRASADAVAVTPDGRRLYVANQFDDTVSVINTATYAVIDTVAVGDGPSAVVIGPEVIGASPSPTIGTPPVPTATPDPGEPCGDTCTYLQDCRAPCGARIVPGYCSVDCRCVAIGTETPTASPTLPPMSHTATPTITPSPLPTPTVTAGESCGDTCTPFLQPCRNFFPVPPSVLTGFCNEHCRCIVESTMTASGTPTWTRTATPTLQRSPTRTATASYTPTQTPTETATYTHTRIPTVTPPPTSTATSTPIPSPTPPPTLTPPPTSTIPPSPTKTSPPGGASGNGCTLAPAASSTPAATMLWLPLLLLFMRRLRRGAG
jgi:YVTN family beta-propeller protein